MHYNVVKIDGPTKYPSGSVPVVAGVEAGRVSLKDVALRAGVSVKTVSNVVRGAVPVTEATRERVQASLDALGYRPNVSARSLRHGRTGIVALALPAIDSPYFSGLARAMIDVAGGYGLTVLIDQTDGRLDREVEVVEGMGSHLVDGVVLSPLALGADELARRRGTAPLVLLGERVREGPADHVAIDNVAAAREATQHLLSLGRRRVAAVGVQEQVSAVTAQLRLRGYREAMAGAGVPVDEDLVVAVGQFGRADGAAAAQHLLSLPEPPDAVFCFDDLLALGVLRALAVRGVSVPGDVAVVGFDDIQDGAYASPSLTTVRPDVGAIASHAMALLDRRLGGDDIPPCEVVVGHRLVTRESSVGPLAG